MVSWINSAFEQNPIAISNSKNDTHHFIWGQGLCICLELERFDFIAFLWTCAGEQHNLFVDSEM